MPSSRGSSQPRDGTYVSCIGRWILYHSATREAHGTSNPELIVKLAISSVKVFLYSPAVPKLFGTRDWFYGRQHFLGQGVGQGDGDGFRIIQEHYIYCALYSIFITSAPPQIIRHFRSQRLGILALHQLQILDA